MIGTGHAVLHSDGAGILVLALGRKCRNGVYWTLDLRLYMLTALSSLVHLFCFS